MHPQLRKIFAKAFFVFVLLVSNEAQAACTSDQEHCDGFANFFTGEVGYGCFLIFDSYGLKNRFGSFCLHKGEAVRLRIRTGDRYCYNPSDYYPERNCSRQVINVE